MRDFAVYITPVAAHQAGNLHGPVENSEVVTLANEPLRQHDKRRFTQIVGALLESQTEEGDALTPMSSDCPVGTLDDRLIAWKQVLEEWRGHVASVRQCEKAPHILG